MPGEQNLDNTRLGPSNGAGYQTVALNSTSDRQAALDQIQSQLASGTPVTFLAVDPSYNNNAPTAIYGYYNNLHQMVIIGETPTELEIYNPWGYTVWIPKKSFIDGDVSAVTGAPLGGKSNISQPVYIEEPSPSS